jgi:hypothetical protein
VSESTAAAAPAMLTVAEYERLREGERVWVRWPVSFRSRVGRGPWLLGVARRQGVVYVLFLDAYYRVREIGDGPDHTAVWHGGTLDDAAARELARLD